MTEKYTPEKVAELVESANRLALTDRISHEPVVAMLTRTVAALTAVSAERDAYKRAKAENDERFMIERDEARAERDKAIAIGERILADAMDVSAERDEFRTAWNAYESLAERDRLHKAITEALAVVDRHASAELHNETVPLNRLSDLIPEPSSADYRAALDKEGSDDEPGNPEA